MATSAIYVLLMLTVLIIWTWRALNWVWLRPKRLERLLREQGLQGSSYRLLVGDSNQMIKMLKEAKSKPMNLSHNIAPRVFSFYHQTFNKYGKNAFIWFGPTPRLIITDPEQIKDVFNRNHDFTKLKLDPLVKLIGTGLANYEGQKWAKHRRIINPAFSLEKLKIMLPTFSESCNDMIRRWEGMLCSDGSCEMDVWPFLQGLTRDVISRTAFGSSYEEGRRIFELLTEQAQLLMKILEKTYIPAYRFLPIATHRRMRKIDREIQASLKEIINKKEAALKAGEATKDDLLGILLESNHREIEGQGKNKSLGMTLQDVIQECKIFYIAGQETTSVLLVWTMLLLSRYPDWQARAREEIWQVFGNQKPDFDGLSQLKIVTMILYEVLRLYPPVIMLNRTVRKDMKLGNLSLPAGVQVTLAILLVHHDHEIWGDDAEDFNPERFRGGILKATKGQVAFLPFGWGPRICIGQNFAMLEAKLALSMILQRFSFELSPSYAHAPTTVITLQPEYGANVILHKL
ncbi:hypothetical protein L6164_018244 [Bauhinia variegata]|uniref:Uncharacterized protein n=1 Tax=Bauhinia variegata TaxID=167791 RepID=A0ACB9NCJ3_BAUVA|nr:hypothetical protein L6164_018244 [Bauhinia variegata]